MYEAAVPSELRDRNIVAGKATIEKLVEERASEKERKKKVRLIEEGVRRKFFQQGSGLGDILKGMCTFVIILMESGLSIRLNRRCGS